VHLSVDRLSVDRPRLYRPGLRRPGVNRPWAEPTNQPPCRHGQDGGPARQMPRGRPGRKICRDSPPPAALPGKPGRSDGRATDQPRQSSAGHRHRSAAAESRRRDAAADLTPSLLLPTVSSCPDKMRTPRGGRLVWGPAGHPPSENVPGYRAPLSGYAGCTASNEVVRFC
jgi:hypothetical protein